MTLTQALPTVVHRPFDDLDSLVVTTLRTLAIDMVEQARSGHPGAPMGMAPSAHVLWSRFLRHAPTHPDWSDRDRFVLSAGHASALLYAQLHLAGYDISMDDLRAFRSFGSRTPGHPERGATPGVEVTTGPLGQGFANAVGMAIAERRLADDFNRAGHGIVDHRTWVLCGDGDLQEGVVAEAASLAGHLNLGKLTVLYDDNRVQLDGPTSEAWSEDVLARFAAYGWQTLGVEDGNDLAAIADAIERAIADPRPTLIAIRTHIGWGAPNRQDSHRAHGSPLGADEARAAKAAYGSDPGAVFHVPAEVASVSRRAIEAGAALVAEWDRRIVAYETAYPGEAEELARRLAGDLPKRWEDAVPSFTLGTSLATRAASGSALGAIAPVLPELLGGSADLSSSNQTDLPGAGVYAADQPGRNIRYGVREHAMAAIANGIAAHGGFLPFVGTFLVFSDYARPAIRLAALSGLHVVYVFTHDSVAVGEDGPTHQPIEQLASLRLIPDLWVLRPADANETAAAWRIALERRDGPVALVLGRQAQPVVVPAADTAAGIGRGAYVVRDPSADGCAPDLLILASGSEVPLALEVANRLTGDGLRARVVSMPCWELFEAQPAAYRQSVLPREVTARLSIEAGVTAGWERWVGDRGACVGVDRFGASGPAAEVQRALGLDVVAVSEIARGVVAGSVAGRVAARPTSAGWELVDLSSASRSLQEDSR